MQGIERQYLRECIEALCKARYALLQLTCEEAVTKTEFGKKDTLLLDAIPEATIIQSLCDEFDPHLPLITEEIGSSVKLRGTEEEVVCFSDPMDRSKILAEFLVGHSGKIGDLLQQEGSIARWEEQFGGDVELSGPYGSITATRHHYILFNVMINYITGIIYIASDVGVGKLSVTDIFEDKEKGLLHRTRDLLNAMMPLSFANTTPAQEIEQCVVTYCSGKEYEDNLKSSEILGGKDFREAYSKYVKYDKPGGPARILYLQDRPRTVFIMANGEKIGEWLGWLAYVKHCYPKLRAYEISFDSSWTRDQILMAPGPSYSILGTDVMETRRTFYKAVKLDMTKLRFLDNPSQYRSTIVICPAPNTWFTLKMGVRKCIELRFLTT